MGLSSRDVYVLGRLLSSSNIFLIAPDDLVSRSVKITKHGKGYVSSDLVSYNWEIQSSQQDGGSPEVLVQQEYP